MASAVVTKKRLVTFHSRVEAMRFRPLPACRSVEPMISLGIRFNLPQGGTHELTGPQT